MAVSVPRAQSRLVPNLEAGSFVSASRGSEEGNQNLLPSAGEGPASSKTLPFAFLAQVGTVPSSWHGHVRSTATSGARLFGKR